MNYWWWNLYLKYVRRLHNNYVENLYAKVDFMNEKIREINQTVLDVVESDLPEEEKTKILGNLTLLLNNLLNGEF